MKPIDFLSKALKNKTFDKWLITFFKIERRLDKFNVGSDFDPGRGNFTLDSKFFFWKLSNEDFYWIAALETNVAVISFETIFTWYSKPKILQVGFGILFLRDFRSIRLFSRWQKIQKMVTRWRIIWISKDRYNMAWELAKKWKILSIMIFIFMECKSKTFTL